MKRNKLHISILKFGILLLVMTAGSHPLDGQRFSFGFGASGGFSQIDGDKLYGFDKLVGEVCIQGNYHINKQSHILSRLAYGNLGSKFDTELTVLSLEEISIAYNMNDISAQIGYHYAFNQLLKPKKKRSREDIRNASRVEEVFKHGIQVGLSFHRINKVTAVDNLNYFVEPKLELDASYFKTSGIAFNLEYQYHFSKTISGMVLFEYFGSDLLREQFLDIRKLIPVSIKFGLLYRVY